MNGWRALFIFILLGLFIINSLYHSGNGSILIVFQFKYSSKNFVVFSKIPFEAPAYIEQPHSLSLKKFSYKYLSRGGSNWP